MQIASKQNLHLRVIVIRMSQGAERSINTAMEANDLASPPES